HYIVATIDSGIFTTYRGKDRAAWQKSATDAHNQLTQRLAAISADSLSPSDQRALSRMRSALEYFAEAGVPPVDDKNKCSRATQPNPSYDDLRMSLYACFGQIAEHLQFNGKEINRVAALGLLGKLPHAAQRKELFLAFVPLWKALNADDAPDSPYRSLIFLSAVNSPGRASR